MKKYRYLDHTADIIVEGWGDSLEDAFSSAAIGMFALITDDSDIKENESITFEVESIDIEGLFKKGIRKFRN